MKDEWQITKRIINVSNRLPVKIAAQNGKITYQNSEGGLATSLASVFEEYDSLWIGWPGAEVSPADQPSVIGELNEKNLYPVFLSANEIRKFYDGFSNEIIWPLFHNFPSFSNYDPEYWAAYEAVNRKFADEILKYATEDDIVWIQDYHLMLLPQMLRAEMPGITIGYFQHIPFPTFELFRAVPWKERIIKGLLGANTIGFQTDDDSRHFLETATQLTDITINGTDVQTEGRTLTVQAFPISIDYRKFRELANSEVTQRLARKLKKSFLTRTVISIDRLDYSKGIIQRLQAFELFLKLYPDWHEKVTFIHLVVPSRESVDNYRELKEEMNKLISDINGKYATLDWQPVHHFYRSFPPNMLSAMYKTADVALVTPLIDGMNLVSKEYVASNVAQNGVLILSEVAGAAKELKEALTINPNDITAFAATINQALCMPSAEKKQRMSSMQQTIQASDIFHWAGQFLNKLRESDMNSKGGIAIPMNHEISLKIDQLYARAKRRLILLDYDGTMVPFYNNIEDARPDAPLLALLNRLAKDNRNDVVIISGRDSATLDKWLGHLPVQLVAEHGAWIKYRGQPWYGIAGNGNNWKHEVNHTLKNYILKVPGAFIEEKSQSIAWHYRAAKDVGEQFVKEIVRKLSDKIVNKGLDILLGNKVIEIKNQAFNKGKAVTRLLTGTRYDFILAIGDDRTDEDMFKVLPEGTISIKVGSRKSIATYYQPSYLEVRSLLKEISETTIEYSNR